jgi:hypothetical protein
MSVMVQSTAPTAEDPGLGKRYYALCEQHMNTMCGNAHLQQMSHFQLHLVRWQSELKSSVPQVEVRSVQTAGEGELGGQAVGGAELRGRSYIEAMSHLILRLRNQVIGTLV